MSMHALKNLRKIAFAFGLVALAGLPAAAAQDAPASSASSNAPQPPDILFGQLFVDVQMAQLFADQKTFADAVPNSTPAAILAAYQAQKGQPGFSLMNFVTAHFSLPDLDPDNYQAPPGQTMREHINTLWPVLTRTTTTVPAYGSLLALPEPYVIPGGRFDEGYYWDSYFSMLGLGEDGNWALAEGIVENFAHELDTYGLIPNGNRSYYLSRSQPPFFSFMIDLLAKHEGNSVYQRYLPQLKKEYAYWMDGAQGLARGSATERVVRLADGSLLNRYWDARDVPRDESYYDDVTTASQAPDRPAAEVYRDLRAGAASGMDFSSRWLCDGKNLASVCTTQIVPIDLNSLLYHLELTLAKASALNHDLGGTVYYALRAAQRLQAINQHLWNGSAGYYADYNWKQRKLSSQLTAATLYPLYVGAALPNRAALVGKAVRAQLLQQGGLVTTLADTGQQWDAPNGWPPLQWIAIVGLRNYGNPALAKDIGSRYLANVQTVYNAQQKLVEKYIVEGSGVGQGGGGGEYPLQDGFAWTNGITLKLLDLYPCSSDCTITPTGTTATAP